jgi:DNA-binding Lrp family transcriptional regulator
MRLDKDAIQRRALELIAADGRRVAARLAQEFGISRQVASGYVQGLERDGQIEAEGTTRARVCRLATLSEIEHAFPREGLEEHRVWRDVFSPQLRDLPENVSAIWEYGVTEMVNNAIDHSNAREVRVGLARNALFAAAWVADDGEGIFRKLQRALGLHEPREAILELAKGKLTTAPDHHSGEGIFFSSRLFDEFTIRSGHLTFRHGERGFDAIEEASADAPGTRVEMKVANASPRTMKEVFDRYADSEDYGFEKTTVPVRLARHEGERLVSRSQAKRVGHRFEKFKRVELDFAGVDEIGQAFADQLFRVFAAAHPEVRLVPLNTTPAVANMIRRAVGAGSATGAVPGD